MQTFTAYCKHTLREAAMAGRSAVVDVGKNEIKARMAIMGLNTDERQCVVQGPI